MKLVGRLHDAYVPDIRTRVLTRRLEGFMPRGARVLDVGCGDGLLSHRIGEERPDLEFRGVDTLVRPHTVLPVEVFDGRTIPYPDRSFDVVMVVDVFHHLESPMGLFREVARTARSLVLVKDHLADGWLAGPTLRFMDWIGNAHHGMAMADNYWKRARWMAAFTELGLSLRSFEDDLRLYPAPANWIFGRGLHFIAALEPTRAL